MKIRIKEIITALQQLDSDTWEGQLLPQLTEDDPFVEVYEIINKFSEKVKESNDWLHKFEKIFNLNELKEIEENNTTNSLENQLIHSSKMAQIGVLATEISHEMTQPLTYLNNYLYTLSDDLKSNDPKLNNKLKNNLEIASKEVTRLIKLVNHIQEFARKDTEQIRIPVKIPEVVEQTLLIMDDLIKSSNIKLIKNIKNDLPRLNMNPNDLEQVLINLLQNAVDSLNEIENESEVEILIYEKKNPNNLFIEINDNGQGLDEEIKNKIFTPFYSTKLEGMGTGLGLNIVQKIIGKYNGTIDCKSSSGKGASFIISLPVQ
jgi:signal transduction histidine kinase